MLRNPPFCSFASFSIVLLTLFIHKSDSSKGLLIFMISSISSFGIINVVVCGAKYDGLPKPIIFSWIHASPANAPAVNPNGIKMLLPNGLSTFVINGKFFLVKTQEV